MGWWHVDADTLAAGRFTLSPLSETVAAVMSLERGEPAHPGDQHWLSLHRPAYRERLAADPTTAQLIRAALGRFWLADYLTPTPTGDLTPTDDATPSSKPNCPSSAPHPRHGPRPPHPLPRRPPARPARPFRPAGTHRRPPALGLDRNRPAHLAPAPPHPRSRRHRPPPAPHPRRMGRRPRRHAPRNALARRRPTPGQRRRVPTPRPHRHPALLRPRDPQHGWASWNARTHAITYPCTGALTLAPRHPTPAPASVPSPHSSFRRPGPPARDTRPAPPHPVTPPLAPEALTRLLGPVRATVLTLLDTPKSTTHLVALTGQALGTIGRHLKILHDAQLVERRRAGRSVLYYRTPTAEALLSAQHPPTQR